MTNAKAPALRWAAPAAALALGLAMLAGAMRGSVSRADIVLPQGVTGTATIDGLPAPNSAVITVFIDGKQCETTPTVIHPDAGTYHMVIPYGPTCPQPGTMTFFLNGQRAADDVPPAASSMVLTVHLAIGGTGPTAVPSTSPTALASATQTATSPALPTSTAPVVPTSTPTVVPTVPSPTATAIVSPSPLAFRNVVPAVSRD